MRLTKEEINSIKSVIKELDPTAEVKLFGSRVHDQKKGGDIDLLIISEKINFSNKLNVLIKLKQKIGEQKIDVLIYNSKKAFHKIVFKESIFL